MEVLTAFIRIKCKFLTNFQREKFHTQDLLQIQFTFEGSSKEKRDLSMLY